MASVSVLLPGRDGTLRTLAGVAEELSPVARVAVHRLRGGAPYVAGVETGEAWAVKLSGTGDPPAIQDLVVGDPVVVWSSCWLKRLVAVPAAVEDEQAPVPLSRPYVSDGWAPAVSLRTVDGTWKRDGVLPTWFELLAARHDAEQDGFQASRLVVWYRPILQCLLTSVSIDGRSSARDHGWSMELEEEMPS